MKINKKYSGELNKKRWGISKNPLGWYSNGHRGGIINSHVKLNEDLRYLGITLYKCATN